MRKFSGIVVFLLLAATASAQNLSDLIISEACPVNFTGIVDASGQRRSWMELTNVSTGTVNYAGCFITDDKSNLQKYMVPKGVLANRLGSRQVTVIWPSFEIEPGTTLYLVSTDGKTVIDSIDIPEDIPTDMSVRKVARDAKRIDFKTDAEPAIPTPGIINTDGTEETGSHRVARTDPHGWTLTLTSVSVVFGALLILLIIFTISGNTISGKYKRRVRRRSPSPEEAAAIAVALSEYSSEEDIAAIAMALNLYLSEEVHDKESYKITITSGSPRWNDKTRNFRKNIRK